MPTQSKLDPRDLRNVMGTFLTGVTVVTTRDALGRNYGVTANSFSSVSLDPPLILWSQSLTSKSHPAFRDSDHFVVNIMADSQIAVSNHFARSGEDKFSGMSFSEGIGGAPVIDGCAAHLECRKVATYPGGDHVVFLGRVENMRHRPESKPLAFGRGRYMVAYAHDLGPVSLELGGSNLADIEAIRVATAALPDICERVGQHTLCLAVWGNRGPTAIRWEPSSNPVSENLRTGYVMSIVRSATGRAFTAFLPPSVSSALVEEDLRLSRRDDDDDIDDMARRRRFEAHVEEARRHGLARATEPGASPVHQVAVNAFSAPIFNAEGRMVLALSLTTSASRLAPDWGGPAPRALLAAAAQLSERLGYQPPRDAAQA